MNRWSVLGLCAVTAAVAAVGCAGGSKSRLTAVTRPLIRNRLQGARPLAREEVLRSKSVRTYTNSQADVWEAALHVCRQGSVPLYLDPEHEFLVILKEEQVPSARGDKYEPMLYPYTLLVSRSGEETQLSVAKGLSLEAVPAKYRSKSKKDGLDDLAITRREKALLRGKRTPEAVADSVRAVVHGREETYRDALLDRISTQVLSGARWPWLVEDL